MKKFAVFGNPIAHSISPRLHNLAIAGLDLEAFYGRVLLEDEKNLKSKFLELNLSGANITVPFKEEAFKICDELETHASKIGSVNTIVKDSNKLIGYNTDAIGFLQAIDEFGKIKSALILGAGGTARAIAYALNTKNISTSIVNRSEKRRQNFLDYNFKTWNEFVPKGYDLVVNTTSAGLVKNEYPMPIELLEPTLKNSQYAFDAIYNKSTNFLNLAKNMNLQTKNGKDMLVWQAVFALDIFYGGVLNKDKIYTFMNKAVNLGA